MHGKTSADTNSVPSQYRWDNYQWNDSLCKLLRLLTHYYTAIIYSDQIQLLVIFAGYDKDIYHHPAQFTHRLRMECHLFTVGNPTVSRGT